VATLQPVPEAERPGALAFVCYLICVGVIAFGNGCPGQELVCGSVDGLLLIITQLLMEIHILYV